MSKKIQSWLTFAVRVRNHIRDYVIAQYGEEGEDPAAEYTAEDCIKQAQRYLSRYGKQARRGEESLDILKAAHWLQIAHDKMCAPTLGVTIDELDTIVTEVEEAERNFADVPITITAARSRRSGRGNEWTPRDALIDVLRAIDAGELKPTDLFIGMVSEGRDADHIKPEYRSACASLLNTLGVIELSRQAYLKDGFE